MTNTHPVYCCWWWANISLSCTWCHTAEVYWVAGIIFCMLCGGRFCFNNIFYFSLYNHHKNLERSLIVTKNIYMYFYGLCICNYSSKFFQTNVIEIHWYEGGKLDSHNWQNRSVAMEEYEYHKQWFQQTNMKIYILHDSQYNSSNKISAKTWAKSKANNPISI